MKSGLAIEAPARVLPGELLEGVVRWQLERAPDAAVLRLSWTTAGAGLTDEHVVETVDIAGLPPADPTGAVAEGPYRGVQASDALAPGPLKARDARRFRLRAPPSPPSFRGSLIRLDWRLEVVAGRETSATHPLTIAPGGEPLQLP